MGTAVIQSKPDIGEYPQTYRRQSSVTSYLFAIIAVAFATIVRVALMPYLGNFFPSATFLLAVVFTSVRCGWMAGVLAMVLSFMCNNYLFMLPTGSLLPTTGIGWMGGVIFFINAGIIVGLAEGMKKARFNAERNAWEAEQHYKLAMQEVSERREAEERIAGLNLRLQRAMRETHHRVKNNLQVISALVDMQTAGNDEAVASSELKRVGQIARTLANLHDLLTGSSKEHEDSDVVSIKALLEKLVGMLRDTVQPRPLVVESEEAVLPTEVSSSFALLVSELVSNAAKHGAGTIQVKFSVNDGQGQLQISDEGQGFLPDFDPEVNNNVGYDLINTTIGWDLRGKLLCQNSTEGGAVVTVTFPLPSESIVKRG